MALYYHSPEMTLLRDEPENADFIENNLDFGICFLSHSCGDNTGGNNSAKHPIRSTYHIHINIYIANSRSSRGCRLINDSCRGRRPSIYAWRARSQERRASMSMSTGTIERNRGGGVATAQKAKVQSRDHFIEILIGRCLEDLTWLSLFQWLRISSFRLRRF